MRIVITGAGGQHGKIWSKYLKILARWYILLHVAGNDRYSAQAGADNRPLVILFCQLNRMASAVPEF